MTGGSSGPPWVLQCPVVTITRPQPAVVAASLPPRVATITVRWPPCRVTGPVPPPPPRVILLHGPPRGVPGVWPLPPGHPLRTGWSPPPRAPRPPA